MTTIKFVDVTSGLSRQGPYIVLTIRGPKGGTRACEGLSIEEAEKLVHLLTEALVELKLEACRC